MTLGKDFLAGLLFTGLGVLALVVSTGYRMGSATQMGPGYFPFALGAIIALLGLVLCVRSLLRRDSSPDAGPVRLRPIVLVLASVLLFAVLIDATGLLAAIAALVVLSRFADTAPHRAETALMIIVLGAIASAIFVFGLGIPIPLLPR